MDNYHMHTRESGSLVTFLVVGFVLAALVVGGIYTVQKRTQQPSTAPAASTPAEKKPSASPSSKPTEKAPTSPKPAPSKVPKASPVVPSPSKSTSPGTTKGSPLPATGPTEDFMMSTLMFAGLVGMTVAYTRSRYALRFAQQVD